MKKDNILSIVVMGCGLLLVLGVFLPYVTIFSESISLWKTENASKYIYILLGLFVIVLYLINKKTELAYLSAGYGAFTSISQVISQVISKQGFQELSVGFYLILLSSITIAVITYIYDETKSDALINLSLSDDKLANNNQNYQQQIVQSNIFNPIEPQTTNQNNN